MRSSLLQTVLLSGLLTGCLGQSAIKPSEVLDERTGMTVGALQEPIELVESLNNTTAVGNRRPSFGYLGPVEWDRMGEISYGIWIHVAPGNDKPVGDIHLRGAVTLNLDDGPMVLTPMDGPGEGGGPYKAVVAWGQTSYFQLNVAMLKRMAASTKFSLDFQATDNSKVAFVASHDTRATLTEFVHTRGITDD
jgi:hypothetical protein